MVVISIDPGTDSGWALFDGLLQGCGLGQSPVAGDVLVIERPQVYPDHKANPDDLITLAIDVGRRAALARCKTTIYIRPRQWKGQVPKTIHNARVLAMLKPEETRTFLSLTQNVGTKIHNVIDAIGLGLWYLRKEGLRA